MHLAFFIYLILVSILSCLRKYIFAGILGIAAISHISILYLRTFSPVSPFLAAGLMSLFFIFCIYLFYLHNISLQGELDSINRDCQKQEEQLTLLMDKDKNLRERNIQLDLSLSEIVKIYEYVKKLGSTMNFSEAIETLEDTLVSLAHFSSGKLILIEDNKISMAYCLSCEKEPFRNIEVSSLKEYEKNLTLRLLKNAQILLYKKGEIIPLGTLPNDIETLIALPLVVENQLVGITTLENIPLVNTDKIHFISLQFAMEIKKTQLYEKVKELSTIDSLTYLYLRRHFSNLLANELDRGYRQNQPIGFLMIDIDYFKKYNDEYGHLVGDVILKKVASILKEKTREIDLLCRYGGDEFAIALPRTTMQDSYIVAERLRRAVNEHLFQIANEQFQVAISIGVSSCNPKDMHLDGISDTLIDLSDKALYQAKSQGRNRTVLSK